MSDLRTTRSSMTFAAPFRLSAFDAPLPEGTYDIDTEERIIEGNERNVYLRVATLIHVRSGGKAETVTVDPKELEAALASERASAAAWMLR